MLLENGEICEVTTVTRLLITSRYRVMVNIRSKIMKPYNSDAQTYSVCYRPQNISATKQSNMLSIFKLFFRNRPFGHYRGGLPVRQSEALALPIICQGPQKLRKEKQALTY